jgi:ABC-type multidrug transport system fused ATPase/permease subunit
MSTALPLAFRAARGLGTLLPARLAHNVARTIAVAPKPLALFPSLLLPVRRTFASAAHRPFFASPALLSFAAAMSASPPTFSAGGAGAAPHADPGLAAGALAPLSAKHDEEEEKKSTDEDPAEGDPLPLPSGTRHEEVAVEEDPAPLPTTTQPDEEASPASSSSSLASVFLRLWPVVSRQLVWIAAAALLSLAAAALGLLAAPALASFWDTFDVSGLAAASSSSSSSTPSSSPLPAAGGLAAGAQLAGLFIGRFLVQLLASTTLTLAAERVASALRAELFARLLDADIGFFDERRTPELVDALAGDVRELRDVLRSVVGEGVPAVARVVGGAAALLVISPKMTGVLALSLVPMFTIGNLMAVRLRRLARKSQEAQGKAAASAHESLSHVRTVRAFTGEDEEVAKYRARLDASSAISREMGREYSLFKGVVSLGITALAGLVLGYGSLLVGTGELTRGQVASFVVSTFGLEQALETLSQLGAKVQRAGGSAGRVADLLDLPVTANKRGGATWAPVEGDVVFDGVHFAYPSRPHVPVLRGVTLRLPPGKVVAVVGPSGSGKTTLAHLLLRYYEPCAAVADDGAAAAAAVAAPNPSPASSSTSSSPVLSSGVGMVRVDGFPLPLVDIHWLRTHVAYVPQDTALFGASIRENIAYGARPGVTDADITAAAKQACALDFIQALPRGLDTVVGERGVAMSGGQRQRIALARALLRDPKILLLDEATSALDAESEAAVQRALSTAMKGRTTLVVAHRLSTVQHADLIYVMSGGRVVESGSHAELLAQRGLYATLVARQRDGGGDGGDGGEGGKGAGKAAAAPGPGAAAAAGMLGLVEEKRGKGR